ncbi:MAG TPA: hypothetical protein VK463_13285 [Desulfomonilaceae bacterium]|nr:hypothetical protein [Desulfomonilaceae bacterium]
MPRTLRLESATPMEIVTPKHRHSSDPRYQVELDNRDDIRRLLEFLSRDPNNEQALCPVH